LLWGIAKLQFVVHDSLTFQFHRALQMIFFYIRAASGNQLKTQLMHCHTHMPTHFPYILPMHNPNSQTNVVTTNAIKNVASDIEFDSLKVLQ
jgi:hypothetical protein